MQGVGLWSLLIVLGLCLDERYANGGALPDTDAKCWVFRMRVFVIEPQTFEPSMALATGGSKDVHQGEPQCSSVRQTNTFATCHPCFADMSQRLNYTW